MKFKERESDGKERNEETEEEVVQEIVKKRL
jgi:hypothetical protein